MIFSDSCWLKNQCNKALHTDAPCLSENIYCVKLFKLNALYDNALVSQAQRAHKPLRFDADGTDKDIFIQLSEISKDMEKFINAGNNLYLYSQTTGNGKTAWALRLLQCYFNQIWYKSDLGCKALFINIPKLFLSLKDSISNQNDYIDHIKENILNADLIIWDELGTKLLTEFEQENLLNFINNRLDLGKANIYTSNLAPQYLREVIGERLYSRVIKTSQCIEFKGKDKRGL